MSQADIHSHTGPGAARTGAAGTISGREDFMLHIARKLGRSAPMTTPPERLVTGVPEPYAARRTTVQERIDQFSANWSALTGTVWTARTADAADAVPACARRVCTERGIERVSRWDHPDLAALPLDDALAADGIAVVPWRADGAADAAAAPEHAAAGGGAWSARSPLLRATEQCRLGIVWADYAIANTGTLVLLARGGRGRSVSLLTDTLLAVVPADRIVTRMGEAFEAIRRDYPEAAAMPSSVNLITGPSRSADIENDLTIGIHGPGSVYAIILET
ncbi:MAG: lactate utilization protein [Paenibacillus sp.]|jgi:L-lactate utilization protein LutC|uniref:LutC/YkgG family protein n=1 Tax=Paenibacillus sp. GCM10012303 TaxID=3317340 RepID=UPI0029EE16EB|nr:lactate utilization protein [Paenibacillus sp.]